MFLKNNNTEISKHSKRKQEKNKNLTKTIAESQKAVLNKHTPFIVSEAYRTARTNIIFSVAGEENIGGKIIVLTSANPGEGKTTSSINLAITFAQTGAKVLLIDADMRKPRIHQYLGLERTKGLSSVLSKQKTLHEVIFKDVRSHLDCMPSGSIPPNPSELLASKAMSSLLAELRTMYDYIIIDTPPVTIVTDATVLSNFIDGVVMVIREGFTTYDSIDNSIKLLKMADAKFLGFFINDVITANGAYEYAFKKRKRYSYRYSSKHSSYSYKYGNNYSYGNFDAEDAENEAVMNADENFSTADTEKEI